MPNARPSPRSVSTCGPRYPVTIQTLVTFASTRSRSNVAITGLPSIGRIAFGQRSVIGRRRRPSPAAITTASSVTKRRANEATRSRGHDRGCPDDDARDLSTRVAHAAQRLQLHAPAPEDRIVRVRQHRRTRRRALRVPARAQIPIPGSLSRPRSVVDRPRSRTGLAYTQSQAAWDPASETGGGADRS